MRRADRRHAPKREKGGNYSCVFDLLGGARYDTFRVFVAPAAAAAAAPVAAITMILLSIPLRSNMPNYKCRATATSTSLLLAVATPTIATGYYEPPLPLPTLPPYRVPTTTKRTITTTTPPPLQL